MPKRLTKLKVHEVSLVDRGAGEGVRVVLMKKDGKKKPRFTDAGELIDRWDVLNGDGEVVATYGSRKRAKRERDRINRARRRGTSLEKALTEIEGHQKFLKAQPVIEETTMYTSVEKAAAESVVKRFQDRVEEVARAHCISHGAAMSKIASTSSLVNSDDAQLWASYRQASEVVKAAPAPASAPAPTVSAAYGEIQKRAEKLRKRDPKMSEAGAFAAAYSDPANAALVQADRQYHFDKASGTAPVDANAALVEALMASMGIDEHHARGIALELRSKRPPQSTLTHTTRDAA